MIIEKQLYIEASNILGEKTFLYLIDLAKSKRSDYTMLGYAFNDKKEPLLVVEKTGYNLHYIEIINTWERDIYAYLTFPSDTEVFIEEIQTQINSIGYGDLLMTYIKKRAKQLNMKKIRGHLHPDDTSNIEHKTRLLRYYTKHGFDINGSKLLLDLTIKNINITNTTNEKRYKSTTYNNMWDN